jgi:transcriptional regulator with XRE-family HTH domain
MADLVGVPQPTWARWESGISAPRNLVPIAKKIEKVTGVPASWLLGLEEEPPGPPPAAVPPQGLGRRSPSTKWYVDTSKAA